MKILGLLILPLFLFCQSAEKKIDPYQKGELTLNIKGLRNEKGYILIYIFHEDRKASFPLNGRASYSLFKIPCSIEEPSIKIPDLPHGRYAVFAHHDENPDGKIDLSIPDKEILYFVPKWPMEGFGFSEYKRIVLFKPTFEDSSFEFSQKSDEKDIHIYYLGPRYGWLNLAILVAIGASNK